KLLERGPAHPGLSRCDEILKRGRNIALTPELLDQRGKAHIQPLISDQIQPWHTATLGLVLRERGEMALYRLLHERDHVPWESAPRRSHGGHLRKIGQLSFQVHLDGLHLKDIFRFAAWLYSLHALGRSVPPSPFLKRGGRGVTGRTKSAAGAGRPPPQR